jgi:hypothetical protein
LLAVISVLTFVIPGVVTANGVCSATCDCCKQAKNVVSCHVAPSVLTPHQAHGDIPKMFRNGNHYDPFAGLLNPDPLCLERIGSTPCKITAARDLDDQKCPAPSVRLAESSPTVSPALVTSEMLQGDQIFFGIRLRDVILSKFTRVPLYLQKVSIRC